MSNSLSLGKCTPYFYKSPLQYNKTKMPECTHMNGDVEKSTISEKMESDEIDFKIQNKSDSSILQSVTINKQFATPQSRTPISRTGSIHRSRSIPSLSIRDQSGKQTSDDRQQNVNKYLGTRNSSGEKTPVTHFCTPQRNASNSKFDRNNSRQINLLPLDQQMKMSHKQYFSDMKPSATPDCFSKVHIEMPHSHVDSLPSVLGEETSNFTVGVRIRPLNLKEHNDTSVTNVVSVDRNELKVKCDSGTSHSFTYDHCFWSCDPEHPSYSNQNVVFTTMVQPFVDKAFEGYNACLFAYGQTGSGKSYSMMGVDVDSMSSVSNEAGIIPRFCHELFERVASLEDSRVAGVDKSAGASAKVEISYFEIYNEKIHDLLGGSCDGGRRTPLKVREHPTFGPYIVDLSIHGVKSYEDLQGWLTVGNSQRATTATGMNEKSSRSHSIFSVILTQTQEEVVNDECYEYNRRSKINLVDLAGSERLSQTCASGDRLREGVSINRSLLTLGKVIAALAENTNNRKIGFVPYRDSVLTWLLRESLGGNSRTAMLATISPASNHLDETLATLRYACQARTIVNKIRVNENPHDTLIRELRTEVDRLRTLREDYELQARSRRLGKKNISEHVLGEIKNKEQEIEGLKYQLKQSEKQLSEAHKSWSERLEEAEKCKSAELMFLHRCGVALQLDWEQQHPCLVNLTADPILSGTLFYLLPPGTIRVGRQVVSTEEYQPDIALDGPLVSKEHCIIKNEEGNLSLQPGSSSETFVNGEVVMKMTTLHHGDRVVIGGCHYFRVSNPHNCQPVGHGSPIDYDFAHQEILRIQENKLHTELEESKKKALEELEKAHIEAAKQLGCQRTNYEQQLQQLGTTLEEHKNALAEVCKEKVELEIQKGVLEAEVENQKTLRKEGINTEANFNTYTSNFLQEIEAALNETVVDAENVLKMDTPDKLFINGAGLHEMQIMVREATQRCKDVGIHFEFQQQQIVAETSLKPVVRVRDRDKNRVAFWEPSSFITWLHRLRDHHPSYSLNGLMDLEVSWEEEDECEATNTIDDSLNGSRMYVNTRTITKQLNESILQLSMDTSLCNNSISETSNILDDTTTTEEETNDEDDVNEAYSCITELEQAADRLKDLCELQYNKKVNDKIIASVHSVNCILSELKIFLNESSNTTNKQMFDNDISALNVGSEPKQIHSVAFIPNANLTPGKSSFRSPCNKGNNGLVTPRAQKSVRFQLDYQSTS